MTMLENLILMILSCKFSVGTQFSLALYHRSAYPSFMCYLT